MPAPSTGMVEQLFIATDPATSKKEVWYRNQNVIRSLQVRQFLNADPIEVRWQFQWKSSFVVQTGTFTQEEYAIFNLVRSGTGPTAVANFVRIEKPANPAGQVPAAIDDIQLCEISASSNALTAEGRKWAYEATGHEVVPNTGTYVADTVENPIPLTKIFIPTTRSSVSGSEVLTLAKALNSTGTFISTFIQDIQYGLDEYGDLILLLTIVIQVQGLTGTVTSRVYTYNAATCSWVLPTPPDVVSPITRGVTVTTGHLFIINHTRRTVIFRTCRPSIGISEETYGGIATVLGDDAMAVHETITEDPPGTTVLCTNTSTSLAVSVAPAGKGNSIEYTINRGTNFLFGSNTWAPFSFMDMPVDRISSLTGSTVLNVFPRRLIEGIGPEYFYTNYKRTIQDFGFPAIYDYDVNATWPLSLRRPMKVAVQIRRDRTTGPAQTQWALYLWDENTGRFTEIMPWTDENTGTSLLPTVLTGNGEDLIYYTFESAGGGTIKAYLYNLERNEKVRMSGFATESALRNRYFRMMTAFSRFLYVAAENPGEFRRGWFVDGRPRDPIGVIAEYTTVDDLLAPLPTGVAAPVIPLTFNHDHILADVDTGPVPLSPSQIWWWEEMIVTTTTDDEGKSTTEDGVAPATADLVGINRAVILCHPPTDERAAFIARFPGRSDGAGGAPAVLDITASGQVTETVFTSYADRYEHEAAICYLTSAAATPQLMLAQELQNSGPDLFRWRMQTGLQPAPGTDAHRIESIEPLIRRGQGSGMPALHLLTLAPISSNVLAAQEAVIGASVDLVNLADRSPVKGVTGVLSTGRFFGLQLKGTNFNSVFRYLGSIIRGRRMT